MMTTKREVVEKMCGGKGHVIIDRILGEKELNGKCGLYAKVTIEPGCSLGYHEHHNESETYFILAGQGDYDCLFLLCGIGIIEKDEMMECVLCHKKELSKTRCEQGHYVCNECHTKGMDAIIEICLSETSKNPVEIIKRMMA